MTTTTSSSIAIRHVVIQHQVADAIVTAPDGTLHRVGHLPGQGWICTCPRGTRCPAITQIRDLIPAIGPAEQPPPSTGSTGPSTERSTGHPTDHRQREQEAPPTLI